MHSMNAIKPQIVSFLDSIGPFNYAATINLKKRHPSHLVYMNQEIFEHSGRWFISTLNKLVLKRRYKYGHERLKSLFCMEKGKLNQRPHLHLAIGRPLTIGDDEFIRKITAVHKKMDWAHGQIHITPYESSKWINYMIKDGFSSLVIG